MHHFQRGNTAFTTFNRSPSSERSVRVISEHCVHQKFRLNICSSKTSEEMGTRLYFSEKYIH